MRSLTISEIMPLTLHIWLRPVVGGGPDHTISLVAVTTQNGTQNLRGGTIYNFQMHSISFTGPATIEWDETKTDVRLAYIFSLETVANEGITVLWLTEANAPATQYFLCHLKPPFGWMNYPNGVSFQGSRLHVFYQHAPDTRRWNSIHWGHAATDNMIDWVHYSVFLHPDPQLLSTEKSGGGIFSGSAIPMPEEGLRVFYTDRNDNRLPNWEWQMTTLSRNWINHGPAVPIIQDHPPESGIKPDNRAPYIFKGADNRWKLLLGGADDKSGLIYLYESDAPDAASGWRYAGIFYRDAISGPTPIECPCLVPLTGKGEGLHLLIFGIVGQKENGTLHRYQAFGMVGHLESGRFIDQKRFEMDFGTDAYAFQIIPHMETPLMIGWSANWADVAKDRDFPSAMTFPRTAHYDGAQLYTPPVAAVDDLRDGLIAQGPLTPQMTITLPDGLGEILLEQLDNTSFTMTLEHPEYGLHFTFDSSQLELLFEDKTRTATRYVRPVTELYNLRLFIDRGLIEFYANDGAHCCTKRFDSPLPVNKIEMAFVKNANGNFRAYRLRPAKNRIRYSNEAWKI